MNQTQNVMKQVRGRKKKVDPASWIIFYNNYSRDAWGYQPTDASLLTLMTMSSRPVLSTKTHNHEVYLSQVVTSLAWHETKRLQKPSVCRFTLTNTPVVIDPALAFDKLFHRVNMFYHYVKYGKKHGLPSFKMLKYVRSSRSEFPRVWPSPL